MDHNLKKLFEDARKVSMTDIEKSAMRSRLDAFVGAHPAEVVPGTAPALPTASPYYAAFAFFRTRRALLLTIIFFVFLGAGSVFAQNALPGSLFYGVKTGLNEEVRGWFAVSPEAKAKWELSLADTRLNEVEELSDADTLTPDDQTMLEESVDTYTTAALSEVHATATPLVLSAKVEAKATVPTLTTSQIQALKETLTFAGVTLGARERELSEKGTYIEAEASLINARKNLFNASSALKAGNADDAERFYDAARSFSLPPDDTEATTTIPTANPTVIPSNPLPQAKDEVKTILKVPQASL